MRSRGIVFLLVQIEEAHSTAWPIGLAHTPTPQASLAARCARAQAFVDQERPPHDVFPVCVDAWDNSFAQRFRCWPDKFYCIDRGRRVLAHSEYGDAMLKKDCTAWVEELLLAEEEQDTAPSSSWLPASAPAPASPPVHEALPTTEDNATKSAANNAPH